MAEVVDSIGLLPSLLAAPRAVVLVAVEWSPWHRQSVPVLHALEASQGEWLPDCTVSFFVLWPERDEPLNRWYEDRCQEERPRFDLSGGGYAPFWWLVAGRIVDCLSKPYGIAFTALQERSAKTFEKWR
jgi:hypothetical protein